MATTAKLIIDGHDQILLIPEEYYVAAKNVRFRQDEETGEVIISPVYTDHQRKKRSKKWAAPGT